MAVPDWLLADERVRHSLHRPAQPASTTDFPEWVADPVRGALAQAGIHRLWQHQADAAAAAHAGRHVALATGTASGKTLAYLLPVLAASAEGRLGFEVTERTPLLRGVTHSALYLAPTKALAHDPRHTQFTIHARGSSGSERRFTDWQMGYADVAADALDIPTLSALDGDEALRYFLEKVQALDFA